MVVNIIKTLMGDILYIHVPGRNFFEAKPVSRSCFYAEFNAVFRIFIRSLELGKPAFCATQALW
jgi:hypothetical protein